MDHLYTEKRKPTSWATRFQWQQGDLYKHHPAHIIIHKTTFGVSSGAMA